MPVSDQLVILALAIASPANPQLPLSLNADSIGQPTGGAHAPVRVVGEKRDSAAAATRSWPVKCPSGQKLVAVKFSPNKTCVKACPQGQALTQVKTSDGIVVERCELK